ncbi:SfiI-subtelomeric fragment related protein family member, putative [Theileria annulata]|uniref:SfiI-subtelomeric related protein family member, putative n=1 Tax=Theileria annulata TaxID=5874 RepID=Q4UJ64_THEAN|nr:SfiI-subtelomeric fragment related protein family member, putative [Theileria annulata]CAI72875.1 SfiI-subtelomeric fragment related protein family member, putative [Theileria annulata]
MKKWTITVNLLFYITFLNQWKAVESQPTSSSRGSPYAGTSPAGGQTSTTKSQNQSASSSSQSRSSQSSSQPASSGSKSIQPTRSSGGTQPSGAGSTPTSQSQSRSSQSSTQSARSGTQSQSVKTASQPTTPSSGAGTSASPSGSTQQPKASGTGSSTPPSSASQPPKAGGTSSPTTQTSSTPASQTPTSQSSSQSTGTGTSAGQVSKSPTPESQPESSSSETDQSSSGSGSGTDGTVVTKSIEPTKVTLDIDSSQGTSQFGYSKSDKINTFTVKDEHVFSKVNKGTDAVWDSKGGDCGTKVIFIDENKKYVSILLTNNMFLLFHLESGQWKDITSTRHDIDRLKFFGDSDNPLTKNDFDVTIADYSYRFTFKGGVNCKKIKYADDDLWKDTDDSEFAEITAFDLGLISNNFFVKKGTKFKKLDFNPTQAKGGQSTTPVSEVVTATTVPQTSLTILTEDAPEKAAVTVLSPTGRPRPAKTPEVATGHRTAITLNIAEKASNSAVDFKEDYLKNVMVFSAMEKYVFNKIIKTGGSKCCGKTCCESEIVIWEAKDRTEHFHKVYVDGLGTFSKTKNLSLHLCNGTFKHLNGSDSGPWSESPGVVDLDVRISNSNIQVDYFKKDNYRIYVAKPGYTIRKVMKSKKCSSDCCCPPKVIWEAQNEHALKVVLMGSKKEPKHLGVLMMSGELNLLFKGGKDEPWQNITSTKNKITDLKMYAMADDNTVELHKGHYSITLFNEFYGYLFYEGVGCVKVTHKGKTIWDLREEGDFGCLKGVFLDLKSNKFNVMNDDDRCWLCEEVRKVNPVTLDVSSKASTDDFDFTVDHNRNIKIYTSKGNAMFYQVVKKSSTNCCGSTCCDSEVVIWETKDPQNYATKVFADGVGACSSTKNVSIYLLNGDILHFSEGDNVWKKSDSKIVLDVDKTSSTIGYDFVHHGETRTFTVKPGYQFKTVMVSKTFSTDHTFWEAQTDEEWSTKVTVYGVQTNVRNINIFKNDGSIKHFHKANRKWVSTTPFVLDIESNTDNDLFEYRSTRNFGHFNPKANLTIEKIIKTYKSNCCVSTCFGSTCCGSTCCGSIDELVIWTATPEDHGLKAVLMGSGKDEKFMSILLQSGNFVLLRKCGKGQCWEDITQDKSDFSNIKMYSLDEGTSNYHELTNNDYDPIIFESRYGYEFKEGVKCVKITYNDKPMWSHTDDPEFGYLKGLYLDLPKDQFSVTNLKDQTKQLTRAKIAKVTLDINKTESTNDFDHSKKRNFHKYTPKSFRLFSKVVQGTTDIWDSGDYVFGTSVGVRTKDGHNYVAVLLDNGSFKLFQESGVNWTDITSSRFNVKMLQFYDKNDYELNSSNYTIELLGHHSCSTISYLFDRGPKCMTVMYGNDIIWDENSCCSYKTIERFDFDPISNIFYAIKNRCESKKIEYKPAELAKVIADISKTKDTDQFYYSKDGDCQKYTPKPGNAFNKVVDGAIPIWDSKDNIHSSLVRTKSKDDGKYLAILLTDNSFKLFKQEAGKNKPWVDITSQRHDISKLKFLGVNDVEIKSSDYKVTIVDYAYEFKFNDSVNCKKIKFGEDVVWKHSDDPKFESITKFQLGLISNSFFVVNNKSESKKIEQALATETKISQPKTAPVTLTVSTPVSGAKPKGTPVSVDIEKTQSTNDFEYTDDNGVISYKPKSGHAFNKVVDGTKDVWASKDDVFGTLVRIKVTKNIKYLAILLDNHMFSLFELVGSDWKDITSQRYDVSKLKFFGENDVEISKTHYTVAIVFLSYEFTFNKGVKCKKIKLAHDDVWKDTDDAKYSDIKSFSLGLTSNTFFVKNQSDQSKKVEFKPTEVTKVTVDINGTQSTDQFDYTDHNGVVTYKPKDNHVINKLVQGTTDIWESKNDVNGILVRTKVSKGVKFLVVLLDNNMFTVFQEEAGKWQDVTSKRHDVTKLRFIGDNDVELSKTDYSVTIVDLSFSHIFNTGVNCKKIKLGDDELWKHSDDPKFESIKSFSLGLASNSFFAKNQSDELKKIEKALEAEVPESESLVTATVISPVSAPVSVTKPAVTPVGVDISKTQTTNDFEYTDDNGVISYKPKSGHAFNKVVDGTKDVWASKDDVFGTLVRIKVTKNIKYLAILLDNHMFSLFELVGSDWKDITSQRYDVSKLKFFGENDVEISKTHYTVAIVFLSYEFTFNKGVKCKKIKLAHDDVWKDTDDAKYSDIKSFSLGLTSNNFFVKNQSDQSKKVDFKPTQAKGTQVTKEQTKSEPQVEAKTAQQISSSSPPKGTPSTVTVTKGTPSVTTVTVDVSKTQSTDKLDYSKDGDCHKYTPKDNHVFNKVVDGTTNIWESKDDIRCALVRSKFKDDGKYLAMLLTDNSFKLFQLDGNEWKEITSQRHDLSKLKFIGDNDTELKATDFTVTIVDYSYEFKFNAGIKCKKIKLGVDDVWKHSDDTKFSEITKFQLGLISNSFFVVNNKSESKKLDFNQTDAKGAPVTTPSKVAADMDKTQSTSDFDYSKDASGFVTFTPKTGNVFNKVSKGNNVIWESKDNVCGTLVMTKTEKKEVHLVILLDNYSFVLFHSSDKGKNWTNITSQRHDVKKLKFFGDNDAELSSSDYKVKLVDLSYQYIFNSGVKCMKIKLGEEDLWKHTDDPKFTTITMFHLGLISNNFFVKNSSEFKKLEFKPTQAKSTPAETKAQASPAAKPNEAKSAQAKPEAQTTQAKATPAATAAQTQAKPQAQTTQPEPAKAAQTQAKATPPAKPAGQPKPSAK